jgi:hypothetical protein
MPKAGRVNAKPHKTEPPSEEPLTLARALNEYAEGIGLTEDELLDRISDLAQATSLGGPECLSPMEVAEYCRNRKLPFKRHEHLQGCEDCRALVVASLPGAERRKQFLTELFGRKNDVSGSQLKKALMR